MGKRSSSMSITLLFPRTPSTRHSGHPPPPMTEPVASLVRKKTQGGPAVPYQHCGSLYRSACLDLAPQKLQGNLRGSAAGIWLGWKAGRALPPWAAHGHGKPSSHPQCPSSSSNQQLSAHLQNQVRGAFWSGNFLGCRAAVFGQMLSFANPRAWSPIHMQRVESQLHAHTVKGLVTTSGQCMAS